MGGVASGAVSGVATGVCAFVRECECLRLRVCVFACLCLRRSSLLEICLLLFKQYLLSSNELVSVEAIRQQFAWQV